jgi:hypothetical protein
MHMALSINGTVDAEEVSVPVESFIDLFTMARSFRAMLSIVEQREEIIYEGRTRERMDEALLQAESALRSVGVTVSEGKGGQA